MYYFLVATLMFALPVGSIAFETYRRGAPLDALLIAKWFVFWSVGCRLLSAGVNQIMNPAYTANILGLQSPEVLVVIRELGFSNVAVGLVGVLSLFQPSWILAAALAGGVFYGLAGILHVMQQSRNMLENVAMASDLFISIVLLSACAIAVFATKPRSTA